MSWFDASSFANIAKSALREAQKTIDKALDIKEDDVSVAPTNTPVDINSDDFFQSWGLTTNADVENKRNSPEVIMKSPSKSSKVAMSIWGSFTGSFFENQEKKESIESLDDSTDVTTDFTESKLVVQHSEDGESHKEKIELDHGRKRESFNRSSIASAESDKRSSESVEILSNTECSTSPDSEGLSAGVSGVSSTKQTSDSVEVLADYLTSPSSIELMDSESSNDRIKSEDTSPTTYSDTKSDKKPSPDSIEVIADDLEESSVADDTMSSVSESTATTVLDSVPMLQQVHQKAIHSKLDLAEMSNSHESDKSTSSITDIPITRPPSRTALHLPLPQMNLINTQPLSIKEDITDLSSNIIDIPANLDNSKLLDESSQSDKTLIASDFADNSDMSDTCNSTYLKDMIADAMVERSCECNLKQDKAEMNSTGSDPVTLPQTLHRETSPLSSEKSDMIKIAYDQTSGHTSGDEMETTTSSDIEIISSPNGDSSSTHSRHSPSKIKYKVTEPNVDVLLGKMTLKRIKGHNRELSEASSISDESEIEKLMRRIAEITEILEHRDAKLIEVSRKNAELQESNNDLRNQLDAIHNKQIESLDLSQVTEEYTQRLSALERKFQQAIREKDSLKKQLDECKKEATLRMTKSEIESIILEKEETIKELREEGEKLSKQQLQHSNIIKKLRAKEKENENIIKNLKENVEYLTSEVERLKRSLTAKEDVEKSQIEAIHQLSTKNKKLESEVQGLKGNLEDYLQKYETTKKSFDAAKKELADKNRASNELIAREQLVQTLENEKKIAESQNEEIIGQLANLRSKIQEAEEHYTRKEQILRSENTELLRRLEDAERRNEELTESVMEISKPLVRQLESLQATYNMKIANFEQAEQSMTVKINDLQAKVKTLTEMERIAKEDCSSYKMKLLAMETQIAELKQEKDLALRQKDQMQTENMFAQQKLNSEIELLHANIKQEKEIEESLRKELITLRENLEKISHHEDKESTTLQDSPLQNQETIMQQSARSSSPTVSLGKMSLSESLSSSLWLPDDVFDAPTSRCGNMLEMQLIQTNLKQREGEVQQLQWELNRREHERTLLNKEISTLSTKVENLELRVNEHDKLKREFAEVQQQYDTLCQLYGEKVEETEELKLDLVDVKEMYKSQIDELLKQNRGAV